MLDRSALASSRWTKMGSSFMPPTRSLGWNKRRKILLMAEFHLERGVGCGAGVARRQWSHHMSGKGHDGTVIFGKRDSERQ